MASRNCALAGDRGRCVKWRHVASQGSAACAAWDRGNMPIPVGASPAPVLECVKKLGSVYPQPSGCRANSEAEPPKGSLLRVEFLGYVQNV